MIGRFSRTSLKARRTARADAGPDLLVVERGRVLELLDGVLDRVLHGRLQIRLALEADRAEGRELRRREQRAVAVEHQADQDRAVGHQAPAGAEQIVAGGDQAVVLEHQAAGRHLVDDLGRRRRQAHHVAVPDLEHLRHAERARERQVLVQMARLAMHRDRDLRAGSSGTSARPRRGRDGRRRGRNGPPR